MPVIMLLARQFLVLVETVRNLATAWNQPGLVGWTSPNALTSTGLPSVDPAREYSSTNSSLGEST